MPTPSGPERHSGPSSSATSTRTSRPRTSCRAPSAGGCRMDEGQRGALAGFLSDQLGRPTAVIDSRRLSVGHSRAMYRVDTDAGAFVVRVEQGGVFGTSSGEEFGLMAG